MGVKSVNKLSILEKADKRIYIPTFIMPESHNFAQISWQHIMLYLHG